MVVGSAIRRNLFVVVFAACIMCMFQPASCTIHRNWVKTRGRMSHHITIPTQDRRAAIVSAGGVAANHAHASSSMSSATTRTTNRAERSARVSKGMQALQNQAQISHGTVGASGGGGGGGSTISTSNHISGLAHVPPVFSNTGFE